jgi:hypothetical protein
VPSTITTPATRTYRSSYGSSSSMRVRPATGTYTSAYTPTYSSSYTSSFMSSRPATGINPMPSSSYTLSRSMRSQMAASYMPTSTPNFALPIISSRTTTGNYSSSNIRPRSATGNYTSSIVPSTTRPRPTTRSTSRYDSSYCPPPLPEPNYCPPEPCCP